MIIRTTTNGYMIVSKIYEDDNKVTGEPVYSEEIQVIEERDDENDKETLKRLLEAVAEKLGFEYNKFRDDNINITFDKKGHKII